MAERISRNVTQEQRKKAIGEEAWLKYYNLVLFERGLITEEERNRMINKINVRSARSLLK